MLRAAPTLTNAQPLLFMGNLSLQSGIFILQWTHTIKGIITYIQVLLHNGNGQL